MLMFLFTFVVCFPLFSFFPTNVLQPPSRSSFFVFINASSFLLKMEEMCVTAALFFSFYACVWKQLAETDSFVALNKSCITPILDFS